MALHQLEGAARRLQLDPGIHVRLANCQRELTVNFPVKMDDGSIRAVSYTHLTLPTICSV